MKNILVIEDEQTVRANILELLEAEDFFANGAENGLIGALWAREHLPDLIICDVMMPELDGYGYYCAASRSSHLPQYLSFFLQPKQIKSICAKEWNSEQMITRLSRLQQRNYWSDRISVCQTRSRNAAVHQRTPAG